MSTIAKVVLSAANQKMIDGLNRHFAGQSLSYGGTTSTVDDIVADLNAYDVEVSATKAAYIAWKKQLDRQAAAAATADGRMRGLRRYLRSLFGPTSTKLLDFGIAPLVTPVRTARSRLEAVAKGLATRVARHTMGKRQKAKIKGEAAPAPAVPEPTKG